MNLLRNLPYPYKGALSLSSDPDFQNFELIYEAYDKNLFERGYYVSDSLVSRWKKYFHGKLDWNGASDPLALIQEKNPEFMCLLLHPDSFFHQHYHENIKY